MRKRLEIKMDEKKLKQEEEITNKLFQAYGSIESDLSICLPCLLNLRQAIWLMEEIDPYFTINTSKNT